MYMYFLQGYKVPTSVVSAYIYVYLFGPRCTLVGVATDRVYISTCTCNMFFGRFLYRLVREWFWTLGLGPTVAFIILSYA